MTVVVTGGVMWVASFAYQDAGAGGYKVYRVSDYHYICNNE